MKSKGSASLYEVLKSASRPTGDPSPAPAPAEAPPASSEGQVSLKERLAAYKAQKLAAAQAPSGSATAVADPTPVPAAAERTPTPLPSPVLTTLTPLSSRVEESKPAIPGPGERVFRLTFNTAAFAALVVIGLLFVAYAIGVKAGRNRAAETAPETAVNRAPSGLPSALPTPPPVPAPAPKLYAIHLVEWPTRKAEERLKANEAAEIYKKALEKQGIKNVETLKIVRGGEERLAMYVDRFRDKASEPARSKLSAVQKVKVQNQSPFAQASFEEWPQ